MRLARVLVLGVAAVACAASAGQKYETKSETVEGVSDDALFSAAVRVLSDEGYSFRVRDRESGVVATEWAEVRQGVDQGKHSWRVVISNSQVELKIDCQVFIAGEWHDCGDQRNADWAERAPKLLAAIKEEARSHPHPKSERPKDPAPTRTADGVEGGSCYGNGTCNEGLTCASNLCVKLPADAPQTAPGPASQP